MKDFKRKFLPIIIAMLLLTVLICLMIKGCEHSTQMKEENGKSVIESIGEKARYIQEEFEKGYSADSTGTDSAKTE